MTEERVPSDTNDATSHHSSIQYFLAGDRGLEHRRGDHYPQMFLEDATSYLFPFNGRRDDIPVFGILSRKRDLQEILARGFHSAGPFGRSRNDVFASFAAFGNATARVLLEQGTAWYEVGLLRSTSGKNVGFEVLPVENAVGSSTLAVQIIPRNAVARQISPRALTREKIGQRFMLLPPKRTVRVRLPAAYRSIPLGLQALKRAGTAVPDFAMRNFDPSSEKIPYDFDEVREHERLAVAAVTRRTGWNARGSFSDRQTAYYTYVRFLRFQEFKICLRQTVVKAINRIVAIAGSAVGFECGIELQQLPTMESVTSYRAALSEGSFDYAQAIRAFAAL